MISKKKIVAILIICCVQGVLYYLSKTNYSENNLPVGKIVQNNTTTSTSLNSVEKIVQNSTTSTSLNSREKIVQISTSMSTPVNSTKSLVKIQRRKIFFFETSGKQNLNCRQACAVESAAKQNPAMDVAIYHTSSNLDKNESHVKILSKMSNVKFEYLNLNSTFYDTPLQSWYLNGKWKKSQYRINHVSDALRLLVLWKFGGIYLDLDIVVLKSLEDLANCSGLQFKNDMANGVMAFDKHHPFLYKCLGEFNATYNINSWAGNGPLLLARVLMRECVGVHNLSEVSREKCEGVKLLPPHAFYAISYPSWRLFFDSKNANSTMQRWENSYLIHVWNKLSANATIKIGSGQPYELAAIKYCPKIHKICQKNGSF